MNFERWQAMLIGVVFATACGTATEPEQPTDPPTQDGVEKPSDARADAWNWRNNPRGFRTELSYVFDDLPLEGASSRIGWAASYWPYYQDGINYRWQGDDVLSPAEKYDKAFHNWEPEDGFMDLKPWDSWTCEYDEEYYDKLGPVAEWTNRNKGTWRAHNGIDDDKDEVVDADECKEDRSEYDGLETWWGICHAWAPAAIMEDEPQAAVERNGVKFEVSDIKALLIQQWDRASAYMVGGRCNDRELERDDTGRITNSECRDLNAGSWHVIITNLLGKHSRPFVIERTTNYEIWNQPLVGYEVTEQREITLEEAHELLEVVVASQGGTGEFVQGIEEGTGLAEAILKFVNEGTEEELDDDARLFSNAVTNILAARPFETLAELDDVSGVGSSAFGSLRRYVENNNLVPANPDEYKYNDDATRFIEVRMTTDWVTESHASADPMTPVNDRYMRHDNYHYILELNDDGEVIGGEWVGSSNTNHPDFVWLPVASRGGNPHIDIDLVREMIAESQPTDDDDDDDDDDNGGVQVRTYSNSDVLDIPDNDPEGVKSFIEVTDKGTIQKVNLDLQIDHTYRGDLIVQLVHGGVALTVYDGQDASSPWEDDVAISDQLVDGFMGAEIEGQWELRVFDSMGADIGKLVSWSLKVQTN